jgi:hypothetical protein
MRTLRASDADLSGIDTHWRIVLDSPAHGASRRFAAPRFQAAEVRIAMSDLGKCASALHKPSGASARRMKPLLNPMRGLP